MRSGWTLAAGALALAAALTTAPAGAQEERDSCRCVDAEGNEIERCTCFRAPEMPGLAGAFVLGDDRPRLGISLDVGQGPEADARGALVSDVFEDGPSDEAGLRAGDVVVRFDGHDLARSLGADREEDFDLDASLPVQRLLALAGELEEGQEVEIGYLRDGDPHTATVEARELDGWGLRALGLPGMRGLERALERLPDGGVLRFHRDQEHPAPPVRRYQLRGEGPARTLVFRGDGAFDRCPVAEEEGEGARVWIFGDDCVGGLRLVALNPSLGEYFGTDEGVLVADVHPESRLGLESGDVILRIGDRETPTPERVRAVLRSYGADEPVTLTVVRDGRTLDVQGRLGGEG